MSTAPAHLQQLVSIRSQRTEQVIDFLRRVALHGLAENVRFLPESIQPEDIAAFCLPVRVVDEQSYNRAMKERGKSDLRHAGEQDRDYVMSSHEELLRSGEHERVAVRQLEQVLSGHGHVIVRGEPGEGKTTALWLHVAGVCSEFAGRLERWEIGVDDASFRVPLALPLGQLPEPKQRKGRTLAEICRQYLLSQCYEAGKAPPEIGRWLDEKIARREFSICLDALDELVSQENAGPRNGKRAESPRDWLRRQLSHCGDVPVLLTTRLHAEDEDLLAGPIRYRMVCFGPRQVRDFIGRYFQREGDDQLAVELTKRLGESPGPRNLAQLPLLLSILCRLKQKYPLDPLPPTRTKLLERCLLAMMERGDEKHAANRTRGPATDSEKLKVLFHIAARFYDDGPLWLEEGKLVELLKSLPLRKSGLGSADQLLSEFKQDGILVPCGDKRYRFILRSFHEFCLAGSIAAADQHAAREGHFRHVFRPELDKEGWKVLAPGWRHVWPLVAGTNPVHTDWLLDAIWPESKDPSHRDHVIAAAEVIHEAMDGEDVAPPGAAPVIAWLQEAAAIHQVAIAGLGQIGGEASRQVLAAVLQQEQTPERTQWRCAKALGQIGGEAARQVLAAVLQQEQRTEGMRRACAWALGQIGGEASQQVLAAVLQQEQTPEGMRWECAFALGRIGGEASRQVLAAVLQQEQTPEGTRRECAEALGRIGGEASRQVLAAVLQQEQTPVDSSRGLAPTLRVLAAVLQQEQTPEGMRWACAEALGQIGGEASRQVLAAVLQQEQTPEETRWECAFALGQIGGEASRQVLAAVLQQEQTLELTRRACAGALGRIGGEASRQVLAAVLQQEQTPEGMRWACAEALGQIGGEASRQVLAAVLQQEQTPEETRGACAGALGRIGGEASRQVLAAVLQQEQTLELTRRACAGALGRIGGEASRQVLAAVLQQGHTPEGTRRECAEALGRIGGEASRQVLAAVLQQEQTPEGMRGECAFALGQIGGEASRQLLAGVLQQEQTPEETRRGCAYMLAEIGGEASFNALVRLLKASGRLKFVRQSYVNAALRIAAKRNGSVLIGRMHPPQMPDPILEEAQRL